MVMCRKIISVNAGDAASGLIGLAEARLRG
jgi:hypothetical protein